MAAGRTGHAQEGGGGLGRGPEPVPGASHAGLVALGGAASGDGLDGVRVGEVGGVACVDELPRAAAEQGKRGKREGGRGRKQREGALDAGEASERRGHGIEPGRGTGTARRDAYIYATMFVGLSDGVGG